VTFHRCPLALINESPDTARWASWAARRWGAIQNGGLSPDYMDDHYSAVALTILDLYSKAQNDRWKAERERADKQHGRSQGASPR